MTAAWSLATNFLLFIFFFICFFLSRWSCNLQQCPVSCQLLSCGVWRGGDAAETISLLLLLLINTTPHSGPAQIFGLWPISRHVVWHAGAHYSTHYLHSIYILHIIYTVYTQYIHSPIYTVSTQYLHSIYTVSTPYLVVTCRARSTRCRTCWDTPPPPGLRSCSCAGCCNCRYSRYCR